MVKNLPPRKLAKAVSEALRWTRYFNDAERTEFVTELAAVIQDCEELGTFAPMEQYLTEWRNTAAILADPELTKRLSRPVAKPLGMPVLPPPS